MNFKDIIKNFVDITDDTKLGIYMIHLSKATERLPIIKSLEKKLNITLPIFEAKDGYELIKNVARWIVLTYFLKPIPEKVEYLQR